MNYKVKIQKTSNGKLKTHYANIGDKVKEVSLSGDTLIVENEKGLRFSINISDLEKID